MGAFNIVNDVVACPRCSTEVRVRAQFKYGDTWQHEYGRGDRLRWGGNDIGSPERARVVVDAVAETVCPKCGFGDWNLYVFVEGDRIVAVKSATGEYDFGDGTTPFIVLES